MSMPLRTRLFVAALERSGATKLDVLDAASLRRSRESVPPTFAPFSWVTGRLHADVERFDAGFQARDGARIPLRVSRPRDWPRDRTTDRLPVVVHFHGGGFTSGTPRQDDPLCSFLARALPAVVVSVDYRLAPEHRFPVALDDAFDAVRWVAGNVRRWGADGGRLAVVGASAGGNLAAALCLLARDEGGPRIAVQALLCQATDATRSLPAHQEPDRPFLSHADIEQAMSSYLVLDDVDLHDPRLSPLLADDLSGLPPALVQTAEYDALRDDGVEYAVRLAAAGVPVRATTYLGVPHGFYRFPGATLIGKQARHELATELRARLS
jgi:acetyl esterase